MLATLDIQNFCTVKPSSSAKTYRFEIRDVLVVVFAELLGIKSRTHDYNLERSVDL